MNFFFIFIFCVAIVEVATEVPIVMKDPPNTQINNNFYLNIDMALNKIYKEMENKKSTEYKCKSVEGKEVCGCVFEGKRPTSFNLPTADLNNPENFLKIATMPICGNKFFNFIKQCALASMFEDKNPENAPKDSKHKKMLLLLDGCAKCTKEGEITGLRLTHFEESGGFFSKCSEEKEYQAFGVDGLSIKVPGNNKVNGNVGSFSVPITLYHRICGNFFTTPVVGDKYVGIKLHIKYSCGGVKGTKDRVAEIRGLWVNLDDGKVKQYVRSGIEYKLNDKVTEKWMDPNIACWSKKDVCKIN